MTAGSGRTPLALVAVILVGVLASACSQAPASSSTDQRVVTLPEISSLAASVQQQIRDRHAALERALQDSKTPAVDRAAAYGELGEILKAAKFNDEAVSCYTHAEALAPGDARWPYALGHVYLIQGNRVSAAKAFERASALRPTEAAPLVWLGEAYLDEGMLEAAQATFLRALAVRPDAPAALFGAGRVALARQAYPDAVQYLERALAVDPRASAVHYPLAMAYRAGGDANKAEAHLRQRGERWPELVDPLRPLDEALLESPVAYEHRGLQALQRQNWADAAAAFRKGLELEPGDATLRHWLGATLYAAGDATAAEAEFRTVVRQSPDFARSHFSLGAILAAKGQQAEAIQEYAAAVRSDPTMIEARLRLADAQRAAGDLQASFEQYAVAVAANPALAEAWIGGAQSLLALRRYPDAREWLSRARRLHPERAELAALERQARD